ncbi:MAG TPA: SpoIID/LytB domain-containing protein, partial [Solirubrobacteraceae bacterium]|nr:SpoIID/LytB domain-containing protein [Solirubrobacteraceae bacterium]
RGFGHGVGMSQYGTLGYAKHGWTAPAILAHYYTGTALGRLATTPTVRVLLQSGRPSYTIRGAAQAGDRALDPAKTYVVTAGGAGAVIRAQGAHAALTSAPPLSVSPPAGGAITLAGPAANGVSGGSYRGALEFRVGGNGVDGLMAINALGLEDYVAGVISAEVPASWPAEALKTQAIAARTYAITTNAGGAQGFTQYTDTRSQMYKGVSAETPATNAAAAATSGLVVTYQGRPVTTYFFSSSGGRTENVENSFVGSRPQPWLKSVTDPYDGVSPSHRWGPISLSLAAASAKLGSLVDGTLKWITVTRRGVSPRVVQARLTGTGGTTTVTGPQLRRALGLRDAWMRFRTFSSDLTTTTPATPVKPLAQAGGGAVAAGVRRPALQGHVRPARPGTWAAVQTLRAGRWTKVADVLLGAGGAYRVEVPGPGAYRLTYAGAAGPVVRAA